jgi:hypothetical protein
MRYSPETFDRVLRMMLAVARKRDAIIPTVLIIEFIGKDGQYYYGYIVI